MTDEADTSKRSLAPFTFALGVGLGWLMATIAGANPTVYGTIASVVIGADFSYYAFMGWLFKPDFAMQFKVRRNQLAGTVGFKWQSPKSLDLLRKTR